MDTLKTTNFKDLFLLNPEVTFLNHGSYGACPRPVFRAYQKWQRRLEWQPVEFIGRELKDHFEKARKTLGDTIQAEEQDVVYVPNVTYGVNLVARSLCDCITGLLKPGDEILTTDMEYGACNYAWEFACQRSGAIYRQQPISLPIIDSEKIIDELWRGVTEHTKVIYLSHITSPTALRLPVEAICQRARAADIVTVIDGAHAAGQLDLDMHAIGADCYIGNCHKWMLSPKGAGFIYAQTEFQKRLLPLVVSWGYRHNGNSPFIDSIQWTGTHDPASALSVPAAIDFMNKYQWESVRMDCHLLLADTIRRISELVDQPPIYPLTGEFFSQMGMAPLRPDTDLSALGDFLYNDRKIVVPVGERNQLKAMRISLQAYNTPSDMDYLVESLTAFYHKQDQTKIKQPETQKG